MHLKAPWVSYDKAVLDSKCLALKWFTAWSANSLWCTQDLSPKLSPFGGKNRILEKKNDGSGQNIWHIVIAT
jgi:hypothetical protein